MLEADADPDRISTLRDLVTHAQIQRATAERQLTTLAAEPALTAHPDPVGLLTRAQHAWRQDRDAAKQAAALAERAAQLRRSPQPAAPYHQPPSYIPTHHHDASISR